MSARSRERRALIASFTVFGVFWGCYSALVPAIQAQTGLTDGRLGLCLAAIPLGALPTMRLAGRLVDRHGPARLMPLSLGLFALVVPLPALAHGGLTLALAFVLLGVATGLLDVIVNVATAAWERVEAHRLMALGHAGFSAGVLVGSIATGVARDGGADPVHVLPVVAAALLLLALVQPAYRQLPSEGAAARRGGLPRVLLLLGVLVAASFLIEDAVQSWSALRLERGLGAPPWLSALGPGLFAGAMTAGRLGAHVIGGRFSEVRLVVGGGLLIAGGSVLLAVATVPAVALVGVVLVGSGVSVLAPTLFSAVGARSAPGRAGADLAAVSALGYTGFVIGPPLVGLISGATSLPVALGLLGVLGLALAAAAPAVLREPARA